MRLSPMAAALEASVPVPAALNATAAVAALPVALFLWLLLSWLRLLFPELLLPMASASVAAGLFTAAVANFYMSAF